MACLNKKNELIYEIALELIKKNYSIEKIIDYLKKLRQLEEIDLE